MPNKKNTANLIALKDKVAVAKSTAIIDYAGMTVNQMTSFRNELRKTGGEFMVTKNTLISLAFDKDEKLKADLEGMNGLLLSYEDEVGALKAAFTFRKGNDKLVIKSGSLAGKIISAPEVEALSQLPSKNELISQLIYTINAPAQNFVGVLKAGTRNLVYALQAIVDKPAA